MSDRAPQRSSSGPRKTTSLSGRGGAQRHGDNGHERRSGKPPAVSHGGRKRDTNVESGIIITVKEEFGFIRSFSRTEDAFFHYDEIPNRDDALVGQEVTFVTRVSGKSGRETCVNLRIMRNGTFLAEAGDYAQFPTIGSASLERGEVLSVGEKSGVFLTSTRQVAVFDVSLVSGDAAKLVKKGFELACRVVRDPSSGICIAVPPFQTAESVLELGLVSSLTAVGGGHAKFTGSLKWGKNGSEIPFDLVSSKNSAEIREGDYVWFKLHGDRARDLNLCTPFGELPFFAAGKDLNGKARLEQWLKDNESSATETNKRTCGSIAAVRDNFAFIKPDRSGDNLFMPLTELCVSHPDFRRADINPGDFLTFEVKKNLGDKGSDVAVRAFLLPGLNKVTWKRSKEILLASGLKGKVANAGARSVKAIEYDIAAVEQAEAPDIWNMLRSLKPGQSLDLNLPKGGRLHALAAQYCKWLGLEMDGEMGVVSAKDAFKKPAIVPCQAHDQANDSEEGFNYEVGNEVVFDLYFDMITQRRLAVVVPEVLPSRHVELPKDEDELGVISSLNPPLILSTRREVKLKPAPGVSIKGKVGDLVTFTAEESRYGAVMLARNIEVRNSASLSVKAELFGLNEISQARMKGVVLREAPKILSKSDVPSIVSFLQSSYSTGPRSGLIAVGRDEEILQQVIRATSTKETDAKAGTLDWRRENELLRVIRGCKDRQDASEDDPMHVFRGLTLEERRSVEKEVKKQGLVAKFSEINDELCIARTKASASTWASKVGKHVKIAPFGDGRILDVRTRENIGIVYQVGLFPTVDGDYGAKLWCVQGGPSEIEFVTQEHGGPNKDVINQGSAEDGDSDFALTAVRAWVHQGIVPSQAIQVISPTKLILPNTVSWVEACLSIGLLFKKTLDDQLLILCDPNFDETAFSPKDLERFMGNFAFALDANLVSSSFIPIEGDVVEFTPCLSSATGVLRAANLTLITPSPGRLSGEVEELTSKGGWVRPKGKLSAEYFAVDLVGKLVNVGDLVDFYLSEKGDRATKVRLLQSNPKRPSSAPLSTASSQATSGAMGSEAARPRINQELISNAPNASSAAASNQAPGPDGTIGFTRDKWRNKRLVEVVSTTVHMNATAAEFTPVQTNTVSTSEAITSGTSPAKPTTKSAKKKIRADAPEFVPGGASQLKKA